MKSLINKLIRIGSLNGFLIIILGLTVLAGWSLDIRFVTALKDDYIPMAPSSALLFILMGVALILRHLHLHDASVSRLGKTLTVAVFVVASVLLMTSLLHIYSSLEHLGFTISRFEAGSPVGHMSPVTAVSFLLASLSLIATQKMSSGHLTYTILGMLSAFAFMLLSLVFLLAYLFASPLLLYDSSFVPPALATLGGLLILAIGLIDINIHSAVLSDNNFGKFLKNSSIYFWNFVIGVIIIISLAYYYHRQHLEEFEQRVSEELTTIAELKSDRLQGIRENWLADADVFLNASHSLSVIKAFVGNHQDLSSRQEIIKMLSLWKSHQSYDEGFLLDVNGNLLISSNTDSKLSRRLSNQPLEKLSSGEIYLQDLYLNEFENKAYLALILPILNDQQSPIAFVALRIDPKYKLYPLILKWPVPSQSAETLLIRKERHEVLFLNELRFQKHTELVLRFSDDNVSLPAVQAVNGFTGTVEGLDYRGIKVIADVRAVPGSPWFMVAKIDHREVYQALDEQSRLTIILILLAVIALGFALTFMARQQRIKYYKEQYETALRLDIYGKIFSQNSEGITVCDADRKILQVNDAFTEITGYAANEVIGKNPRILQSGRHPPEFYQNMWADIEQKGHWQGEIWNKRKNGEIYPEWLSISVMIDQGESQEPVKHYIGVFGDLSRRKADEDNIRYLAHFDALTDLPNRVLLNDRVEQAINFSRRGNYSLTVMFLDLDRFKNINDSLGHSIGDRVLVEVAGRLKTLMRDEDTVSRLGGDEFVLILPETGANGAAHVAQKILESIARPIILDSSELNITPSIGIAIYPADGTTQEALLKAADSAMYQAKDFGRNRFQFYTAALYESSMLRLQIDNALRGALANNEFELHYQPQLDIHSGKIIGCEALLRWKNKELGQVSPAEFIPIAEDSGQILSIGRWVLHEAVKQMVRWRKAGLLDFTVAVNLSAVQFHHQGLLSMVQEALDENHLPAEYLELELTESLMIEDVENTIKIIDSLQQMGIKLSIDDFGTGYSSLSYLKQFKIHKLKIDQSFVQDIQTDKDDAAIVKAIITLAESLGLKTIAEGVETEQQQQFLSENGCNEVQGYLHSRPLPAKQFEAFLKTMAG